MADLEGEYSGLVKEAPVESTGPLHHLFFEGMLTEVDNVPSSGGEVVRTVPKLVRSTP